MWYILKVKTGSEENLKSILSQRFEVVFPSTKKLEVFVRGKRKYSVSLGRDKDLSVRGVRIKIRNGKVVTQSSNPEVEVVLSDKETPFKGYLFIRGDYKGILRAVENLLDVYGFLVIGGKMRTLSDSELRELQAKIEKGERIKNLLPEKGGKVKVVAGEYLGAEGIIEEVYEDMTLSLRLKLWNKTFTTTLPISQVILL